MDSMMQKKRKKAQAISEEARDTGRFPFGLAE
jgi:hypothetical protein